MYVYLFTLITFRVESYIESDVDRVKLFRLTQRFFHDVLMVS